MLPAGVLHDPVVQRPVILEFQRAERMRDALDRVLDRMSEVIHRVDAPFIPCILMRQMRDPVEDRVPHIDVGRRHIDLRAEHHRAVGILSRLHVPEERQTFLRIPVPVRVVTARLGQRAAVLADLIRAEAADIGEPLPDQQLRLLVHRVKVIGRKEAAVPEIGAQPPDILLDRLHKFALLLRGVRVVEAEIEAAVILRRDPGVEDDGLRVPDMKISVRFRRKTRADPVVPPLLQITVNDVLDEVSGFRLLSHAAPSVHRRLLRFCTGVLLNKTVGPARPGAASPLICPDFFPSNRPSAVPS